MLLVEIEKMIPRARQVLRQTRARIQHGVTDSKGKLVSIFEPHAQILRRGKLHKPTEFGMMVKVREAEGGIVTDVGLVPDKADAPLLELIPKPGHRSDKRIEYERQRWFPPPGDDRRRGRAWRVGGEARISRLKHCFGMHRSRYRGEDGMGRTAFWAAIANNLGAAAATIR